MPRISRIGSASAGAFGFQGKSAFSATYLLIGGGGGGGNAPQSSFYSGWGGGGAGKFTPGTVTLVPAVTYVITIGAGGAGGEIGRAHV